MPYRLDLSRPIAEEVARVAVEELTKAAEELRDPKADQGEAIHDVRKRMKKLRGLLRLVRASDPRLYRAENGRLRDAARSLSAARDRTALIESLDALAEHAGPGAAPEGFATVRAGLERKRQATVDAQASDIGERVEGVLSTLDAALADWRALELPGAARGRDALFDGLEDNYRRARRALRAAASSEDAELFHELRKRVKYHAMHLRLLADAWEEVLTPARKVADDVGDALGLDHDYAVLRAEMAAEPESFGAAAGRTRVAALAEARQAELRRAAVAACRRLFAEKPTALRRRMAAYVRRAAAEASA